MELLLQVNVFLIPVEPIPIPAPSRSAFVPTVDAIPTLKSASSIVVELTINWVPSTYKSPLILTAPVLSPTAAGSIVRVAGPLIVSVLILTPVPDAPVESWVAVIIPLTFNDCAVRLVALVTPNVLIPVTLKSVKVLGAFATALSIVAVVVASNEAMFCSCLAELMTLVAPILKEPTVLIPTTLIDCVVMVPEVSIPAAVILVNAIIVF